MTQRTGSTEQMELGGRETAAGRETAVQTREHAYAAAFERSDARRGPRWLADIRKRAFARFSELGFPTTRLEEWKFTNVSAIAGTAFALATEEAAKADAVLPDEELDRLEALVPGGNRFVLVDGRFSPELSRQGGLQHTVRVGSLKAALASDAGAIEPYLTQIANHERDAFASLNTAFIDDGLFVSIAPAAVVDEPIQLVVVSSAQNRKTVSHPRILIVAGENSQAHVIESYTGAHGQPYFTNAVTEVVTAPGSVLDHYKLQREDLSAFHIGNMYFRAARQSTFRSYSLSFGGAIVRNEVVAVLDGEGVDCTLSGLYLAGGQRLVDNHTTIDHAKPHCGSHEVYKGILGGRARAVFNGKIIVRINAQKTDAKQTNKALLLTDDAQINTKPQLEIFANDVKCTHGAAIGQLDEDALFYLRARGLSREEARVLLIEAFAGEILNGVKVERLRSYAHGLLLDELARIRG